MKSEKKTSKTHINLNYIQDYVSQFGYSLVENQEYHPNKTLKFICDKEHEFTSRFYFIYKENRRCNICRRKREIERRMHNFITELKKDGYIFLGGEYKNEKSKFKIRCPKGHESNMIYTNFMHGARCRQCYHDRASSLQRMDISTIKQRIESRGYSLKGNYINKDTPVLIECPEKHLWEVTVGNFQKGRICPVCNNGKSYGEMKILETLESLNINFKQEFSFHNLVSEKGSKLRFDFAVFSNDNRLLCLIEYDGQQHFKPVKFNNITDGEAEKKYQENLIRDEIKNQYCKDNNIPLLRVPYWEFDNIQEILETYLTKKG